MDEICTFQLSLFDIGQVIDGLTARAEEWEKAAYFLEKGCLLDNEPFIIEECSSAEEASNIAAHYRAIIASLRKQAKREDSKLNKRDGEVARGEVERKRRKR